MTSEFVANFRLSYAILFSFTRIPYRYACRQNQNSGERDHCSVKRSATVLQVSCQDLPHLATLGLLEQCVDVG